MSDFIPGELLVDILKRLSVEDLIRCQSVCKSWYSLITSPNFISIQTQNQTSPTNSNGLLLVRSWDDRSEEDIYSIRFDNDTFQGYKSLDFPFSIIGCFNGVLCLSDDLLSSKNTIFLWNPSIRKSVCLTKAVQFGFFSNTIGFAFCASTNDFKVVRVFHLELGEGYVNKVPPEVEVYDLSKGYWRRVDPKGFPYFVHPQCPQAYLNGAVHWTGGSNRYMTDGEHFNTIVSFDMGTEELGVIKMPESVAQWSWPPAIRVSVLEESLSLILNLKAVGIDDVCDIWVMKEYGKPESWSKLFSIALDGRVEVVHGFLRNGQVLVTLSLNPDEVLPGFELASYDPESLQVKHLGINGGAKAFCVDNFVETLALLGVKGDTVQTQCRRQRRLEMGTGLPASSSSNSSRWDGPKYVERYCLCGERADIRVTESYDLGNKSGLYYVCTDEKCKFWDWCLPYENGEGCLTKSNEAATTQLEQVNNIAMKSSLRVFFILSAIFCALAVLVAALFK